MTAQIVEKHGAGSGRPSGRRVLLALGTILCILAAALGIASRGVGYQSPGWNIWQADGYGFVPSEPINVTAVDGTWQVLGTGAQDRSGSITITETVVKI
jgi:hypothetical protein